MTTKQLLLLFSFLLPLLPLGSACSSSSKKVPSESQETVDKEEKTPSSNEGPKKSPEKEQTNPDTPIEKDRDTESNPPSPETPKPEKPVKTEEPQPPQKEAEKKPEKEPEEPKTPKLPPGTGLKRGDPPPRADFAWEDYDTLNDLFDTDVEKAYQKIAEIYQFDGFRAVPIDPSTPQDPSLPPRILLLTYDADHMAWTINYLGGIAKAIHSNSSIRQKGSVVRLEDREWSSFYPLSIATLSTDRNTIIMQSDLSAYAGFLKYSDKPLNERMREFWPEGRQLEIDFGKGARVAFLYSSFNDGGNGSLVEGLQGKYFFQTPWILRALEGETLKAIWHSSSTAHAEHTNLQFERDEYIRRAQTKHEIFERIWDDRSFFFPQKKYAYRFIWRFIRYPFCPGMYLFGINEMKPFRLWELRSIIKEISDDPGFMFKNSVF